MAIIYIIVIVTGFDTHYNIADCPPPFSLQCCHAVSQATAWQKVTQHSPIMTSYTEPSMSHHYVITRFFCFQFIPTPTTRNAFCVQSLLVVLTEVHFGEAQVCM